MNITRYGKRLIQYFYDPEPANDIDPTAPIWCLGRRYNAPSPSEEVTSPTTPVEPQAPVTPSSINEPASQPPPAEPQALNTRSSSQQPASPSQTPTPRPLLDSSNSFEHVRKEDVPNVKAADGSHLGWPSAFLDDFESRIWCTYRSDFPAIGRRIALKENPNGNSSLKLRWFKEPTPEGQPQFDEDRHMDKNFNWYDPVTYTHGYTSDSGWGCMIRSGQSLLANAFAFLRLGRDWRVSDPDLAPDMQVVDMKERELLSLFADDQRKPFSIHRFVSYATLNCGTNPGEWFGPAASSQCIKALCNNFQDSELRVYVTDDGTDVLADKLFKIAKDDNDEGIFHPTLLLVPTRLGIHRVTPVYQDALLDTFTMPQSLGIAGGRPSSSHYFVGVQGRTLFYLDPHHTRPAFPFHNNPALYAAEEVSTFHTRRLRRLDIEEMDPSMLFGFLFRDEADWMAWRRAISEAPGKHIFHIRDSAGPSEVDAGKRVEPIEDECDAEANGFEQLDGCNDAFANVEADADADTEGWVHSDIEGYESRQTHAQDLESWEQEKTRPIKKTLEIWAEY